MSAPVNNVAEILQMIEQQCPALEKGKLEDLAIRLSNSIEANHQYRRLLNDGVINRPVVNITENFSRYPELEQRYFQLCRRR